MGAEVIKIEPPGAPDPLRTWGQAELDGHHFFWTVHARNKKAVTLNLREARGRDLFLDLVEHSDIIVENFRPGTLEKWGLGYDVLRERNRGIILVRVSGYGQTGPEAKKAGYASVAEAASGLRHMNGFPGGPPPRLALSLGDSLAGMFAAQGALAALYRRTVTGEGQIVDAALTESCLAVQESTIPDYDVGGVVRGPSGTRLEGIAPSNIYRSADGSWVVIAANQDTVFRRLCAAMGQPELADDDRFVNHVARGRNQDELDKIIGDWAAAREPADIIGTLSAAGVISGPINTVAEVVTRPATGVARHDRRSLGRADRPQRQGAWRRPGAVRVARNHPVGGIVTPRPAQRRDLRRSAGPVYRRDRRPRVPGGAVSELPEHVTIREVALRDGLQIEDPIPLSAKLELLAAIAATGVREVEATAFVSPSKVPALADAPEFAARLGDYPDIEFSALVASPNGAKRAIAAGLHSLEYVVSAADGHSQRQCRAQQRRSHRADRRDRGHRPRLRCQCRGDHRHRLGLPVRRPDAAAAGARHRRRRMRIRRRPAGDRRHHRHHHPRAGHLADEPGETPHRRPAAGRPLPQHPRRRAGQCVCRGRGRGDAARFVGRRPGRLPVRTRGQRQHRHRRSGVPVARQRDRRSTSTCRPRSAPRPSRNPWSVTICPARCCGPATGS